ncbi:MAG TPA: hypothetical protein VHE55_19620 [Fimbriimonadaceae bacterium]|nr:hypothetical protein [Fimbriimonadaceae bacterium]
MHNQISRKRGDEPCLELGQGRWRVYPVSVAGVNTETLNYENWTEYMVFERQRDEFGAEYWAACEVPEWAALLIGRAVEAGA